MFTEHRRVLLKLYYSSQNQLNSLVSHFLTLPRVSAVADWPVVFIGWGKTNMDEVYSPDEIRKLNTKIILNSKCQKYWKFHSIIVKSYEVCTLHPENEEYGGCIVRFFLQLSF